MQLHLGLNSLTGQVVAVLYKRESPCTVCVCVCRFLFRRQNTMLHVCVLPSCFTQFVEELDFDTAEAAAAPAARERSRRRRRRTSSRRRRNSRAKTRSRSRKSSARSRRRRSSRRRRRRPHTRTHSLRPTKNGRVRRAYYGNGKKYAYI